LTEVSTRELFELAEFYWNAAGDHYDQDRDDLTGWDELDPIDQGAEAQGMASLLEELESRGWNRSPWEPFGFITDRDAPTIQFNSDKVYTIPEGSKFEVQFRTDPDATQKYIDQQDKIAKLLAPLTALPKQVEEVPRSPREWARIQDVPKDVRIRNNGDEVMYWADGEYGPKWYEEDPEMPDHFFYSNNDLTNEMYGPFTEVLPEQNLDGPWDRWEDVPDGVKYRPTTAENHYDNETIYTNRDGGRLWIWRDLKGNGPSKVPGSQVNAWGPFAKVED
jgi:hypothetical protein